MRKLFAAITAVVLVFAMTIPTFAVSTTAYANPFSVEVMNVTSSDTLQVGFANIRCELIPYNQSAGAFMYKDSMYSNFEYSLTLYGYYVDPNTREAVNIHSPAYGIDTDIQAFLSSAGYGVGLLGARARYTAKYLSNPSYSGTLCLPFNF